MAVLPLSPVHRALRMASLAPVLLLGQGAMAENIITDRSIDGTTAPDSYFITNAATLTASGAVTRNITVRSGSALVLQGSQTTATGASAGVGLSSAEATIAGSVVSADQRGLTLGVDLSNPSLSPSRVKASDSTITGGAAGALINSSQLDLTGSQLVGSNANGVGADLLDGVVRANAGSRIVGGANGVRFRGGSGLATQVGSLTLDAGHVEGLTGSAIAVGATGTLPTSASIDVLNGSTLKGGNGTLIEVGAVGTATITVDNSHLLGDIAVAQGGQATLTLQNQATLKGRLDNLQRLDLNSGAQWTLVDNAQINDLAMAGGSVALGDTAQFHTLQVSDLSGDGTFVMRTDLADRQGDFLDVTGTATGNHQIRVASTGKDPLDDTQLQLVRIAGGDASFSLQGGPVDLGTFAYGLAQRGNEWYLDATLRTLSTGSQTALALFNTAPTVWYGELTILRSRMGEVRRNGGAAGGWMRSYGNQFNAATSNFGYQQRQQGVSFGADGRLPVGDGNWLAGVTAGYSNSDLNLQGGSTGRVDSYHVGAYVTWLDPSTGYYFDGVAKVNRYRNHADVQLSDGTQSKGDYSNNGVGVSAEFGRHLKIGDEGYFIEPYAQLAGMAIEGQSYELDNGLRASGNVTRSLQGKLGTTAGRTFDKGEGRMIQPYVRVAAAHEFINSNRVRINDNSFDNDLAGSRAELGAGLVVAWAQQWQAHAEFDYAHGERLEQPWGASVGVRYNW
ncbi:autotransporter outer membrane beta-barrel domain-containing protein [Pseudomonas sp.]|uniref:autotransporter outer membrane beta-barrel domain-containing protein n=1 Tax=Pseudomonas sp. TaxID=306 RepID=UPI0028A6E980|nr:autotransporter outer membrane beta-barrel domain-containing protein [Pseudomonas sp.]